MRRISALIILLAFPFFIGSESLSNCLVKTGDILLNQEKIILGEANEIAVNSSGDIYISDRRSRQIHRFDAKGNYINTIGKYGFGPGEFSRIQKIVVDRRDNLYIADLKKIVVFDPLGNFMKEIQLDGLPLSEMKLLSDGRIIIGHTSLVKQKFLYLLDKNNVITNIFAEVPKRVLRLSNGIFGLLGLDVDEKDNIYAVHMMNYKIMIFDKNSKPVSTFGGPYKGYRSTDNFPDIAFEPENWIETGRKVDYPTALYILKDKFLIVRSTHRVGERYMSLLDVYSLSGQLREKGIETDLFPVGCDRMGNIYLREERISGDGMDVKYVLHKYTVDENKCRSAD